MRRRQQGSKHSRASHASRRGAQLFLGSTAAAIALSCSGEKFIAIDVEDPGRGPADFLPEEPAAVSDGAFAGGNDAMPVARADVSLDAATVAALEAAPPCDGACESYCTTQAFENPVNRGLCSTLWGVGLAPQPINIDEACRRLYADTVGHFPNQNEVDACATAAWSDTVASLLGSDDFVNVQRRRWADTLRYDTQVVSIERIYDMDEIVGRLYRGELAYDQFAAIVSAHPVLTRRHATDGDRAEALISTFLGRPPFEDERSDLGRLYHLWDNGYYDHPNLQQRLPDAFVRYSCVNEDGQIADTGECTSIKFGFTELVLEPDGRASLDEDGDLTMWAGLLSAAEWEKLQAPGRLLSEEWLFWEQASRDVLGQYLGYPLGNSAPEVTEQMVRYLLDYGGDIRALHYAVLTSVAYRQSSTGNQETPLRFTYGPLKQADAEVWVDSLRHLAGFEHDQCDHRMNRPGELLESSSAYALALVNESDWTLNESGDGIQDRYADLVRNLGGCPDNSEGGRFKIVSVLTTSSELNFVGEACDPGQGQSEDGEGDNQNRENRSSENIIDVAALLPAGMSPRLAVDAEVGRQIHEHQLRLFFGRAPTEEEAAEAIAAGDACGLTNCDAEAFARPTCFALMSSAEMLFY